MPLQVDDQTEQTCAYSEKSLNMQQEMHLRNECVAAADCVICVGGQ